MSLVVAILGIGVLIFVHEYGHYLACLLTKTRTETFSIGFGRRLFGWERGPGQPRRFTWGKRTLSGAEGAMDFRVSLIPLGGYVKMAGENPGEKSGAPDEYGSKPALQRVFIAIAGVVMNVIAAFALYFAAMASGYSPEPARIGIVATGGTAWRAGLSTGERVVEMDGRAVQTFQDLRIEAALLPRDEAAPVVLEQGDARRTASVTVSASGELGQKLGVGPAGSMTLEQGGRSVRIGPLDPATVAGRSVLGGSAALQRVIQAVQAGAERVEVAPASGEAFVLDLTVGTADDAKAVRRLGLELSGLKVAAVRGSAERFLQRGDRPVAATVGAEKVPLDALGDLEALRRRSSVDAIVVQRRDETMTLPVALASPAAVEAFFDDVAISTVTDEAVRVVPVAAEKRYGWDDELGGPVRYDRAAAVEGGIRRGDLVLEIAGKKIAKFADLTGAIRQLENDDPIEVKVRGEDGQERTLSVRPARLAPIEGITIKSEPLRERLASGAGDAFAQAFPRTGREIWSIFRQLGAFFSGKISFQDNVAGPVTIVKSSGEVYSASFLNFLWFLAYISITLAVLNILPVPLLDGGHLLFIAIEKIKGSPLKEGTIAKLQTVGLVLLLTLMVFALKNDFFPPAGR